MTASHMQRTHQSLQASFMGIFSGRESDLGAAECGAIVSDQVVKTRDDVERLMKRIERLERQQMKSKKNDFKFYVCSKSFALFCNTG